MAPKSREERLFGAACIKVTLDQTAAASSAGTIYKETLSDLGLTEAEVEAYLDKHLEEVENALARRGVV